MIERVWVRRGSSYFHVRRVCGVAAEHSTELATALEVGLRGCPICCPEDLRRTAQSRGLSTSDAESYEALPPECDRQLTDLARKTKDLWLQRPLGAHPRRVYVIELDHGISNRPTDARESLYVGESYLDARDRFQQHRNGYKSSKWVRRHGVRLRPDIYDRFPAVGSVAAAQQLESEVADLLGGCGFHVLGGH